MPEAPTGHDSQVNLGVGVALIVVGGVLGLLTALVAWPILPAAMGIAAAAVAGMLVGAGGLLVQDEASPAEWVVTLAALAVLAPLHARLVLGRPGRPREGPMVAAGPGAA